MHTPTNAQVFIHQMEFQLIASHLLLLSCLLVLSVNSCNPPPSYGVLYCSEVEILCKYFFGYFYFAMSMSVEFHFYFTAFQKGNRYFNFITFAISISVTAYKIKQEEIW